LARFTFAICSRKLRKGQKGAKAAHQVQHVVSYGKTRNSEENENGNKNKNTQLRFVPVIVKLLIYETNAYTF